MGMTKQITRHRRISSIDDLIYDRDRAVKMTAVEIVKVNEPSEWQKGYREFNSNQLELLKGRAPTPA